MENLKKKTELTNTNNNTEESAEGLRIFSKSPDWRYRKRLNSHNVIKAVTMGELW